MPYVGQSSFWLVHRLYVTVLQQLTSNTHARRSYASYQRKVKRTFDMYVIRFCATAAGFVQVGGISSCALSRSPPNVCYSLVRSSSCGVSPQKSSWTNKSSFLKQTPNNRATMFWCPVLFYDRIWHDTSWFLAVESKVIKDACMPSFNGNRCATWYSTSRRSA